MQHVTLAEFAEHEAYWILLEELQNPDEDEE